jgi:two-component system chemotaxis sensor kinase CheA
MDELLADFLTETNEGLAELDTALLKLERTPGDEATLGLIFRLMHTIKGTCGFLALPRLERVAHAGENVLGRVRDKTLPVTPDMINAVLGAVDAIKAIVDTLAHTGAEPAGDDAAAIIEILDALNEERAVPSATPPPRPIAAADPVAPAQTIRVDVDVLEDLMTLVSELVLTRNQLLQLARTKESSEGEMAGFAVPLQRLSHITSDLQEGVMKTRMQPIGNAWSKLPRLVRDLAGDLGKKIELVMHGADTELDRQVLELIKDPLTHMVRNSGDHGLETGADRRAAGKPETGRITLNAFHEGGHIVIEIADDGAGLPVDRIRARIVARALATETELAGMSETQIQRFIFRPGFSTAAAITAVSGRGVGMDVVKTNIERIGGTIDLKSVAGEGTVFTIKIPLTLAIVSALIVQAGEERFAIPQISVVELVRAQAAEGGAAAIERVHDTPVLRLRDRLLPLVGLHDLLRLDESGARNAGETPRDATIVVVQVGASQLGIIVDRVFDTEEIVVKPVAPMLRHISMFSGNTILGDGSVIMILDPNGIARATGIGAPDIRVAEHAGTGRFEHGAAPGAAHSDDRVAMLLFRSGAGALKAVPLGLVARLEDIPRDRIETSAGQPVTQYRGRLMPLLPLSGEIDPTRASHPVLVFSAGDHADDRCMGLVVDEIVDVVEDRLKIELSGARPGLLGTAIIAGNATEMVDIGHYLTAAFHDWFRPDAIASRHRQRVLVVEDSPFFRQMLVPVLGSAGYDVTAAPNATQALRLRDGGTMFDAIVSDVEMPDMDGLEFVRRIRAAGPWASLPVIALSGHTRFDQVELGRAAGFTDYVAKFERDALLASLGRCLAHRGAMPAGPVLSEAA